MKKSSVWQDPVTWLLCGSLLVFIGVLFIRQRPAAVEIPPKEALVPVSPFPVYDSGSDVPSLEQAIEESLGYLRGRAKWTSAKVGPDDVSRDRIVETLTDFRDRLQRQESGEALARYLMREYDFFEANSPRTLVTGYFEASLQGSLTPDSRFRYPLYRRPQDLLALDIRQFLPELSALPGLTGVRTLRGRVVGNTFVPYFTRAEIDFHQALTGKGLEAAWVDDLVDLFFLHIQGSGVITLPDGSLLRVGYEDKNGHPYRAIGSVLIARGLLSKEAATMQGIKSFLRSRPELIPEILSENPSYVFFEKRATGPLGSIGATLTPYRSIATDQALFPKGALAYLVVDLPVFDDKGTQAGTKPFAQFVLNQDTGGAITGPGRVDLFTGYGDESSLVAGHLRHTGSLYFLLKKRHGPSQ